MKPHPRIWTTIRVTAALATLLLLFTAVETLHQLRTWQSASGLYVGVGAGSVYLGKGASQQTVRHAERILCYPDGSFQSGRWWLAVPLWMIATGTLAVATIAHWQRIEPKHCPK
jgi:hypothetical protein